VAELEPPDHQSSRPPADDIPALAEADVVAYLKHHPDFLDRHPDVLEAIELSHASGAAVSLIERQVELLRVRNRRLEDRLENLIDTASDNEKRATNVHKLARSLLRAPSLAAIGVALKLRMHEDFDIDESFVGVSGNLFQRHDIDCIAPLEPSGAIAKAFDGFLRTRLIECGPIDEDRARLLFPRASMPIRSAAIVPLEKERSLGLMALGSREPDRFQPRQGKLFLEMVADLVAAAIRSRLS
jgi:uncharacterized protein YigA (DUF484 family)